MPGFTTDAILFAVETATPGTYATVAQQMNVTPPKKKRKRTDVPIAGSDYPVTLIGKYEPMEATLQLLFDPDATGHTDLEALVASKALKKFRITYPDPTPRTVTFDAYVIGFEEDDMPADGKELTATVTFALTALPVVA